MLVGAAASRAGWLSWSNLSWAGLGLRGQRYWPSWNWAGHEKEEGGMKRMAAG